MIARYPDCGWIRLGRLCFTWTCGRAYFSERNGYVRYWRIPLTKWRVRLDWTR